MKRIWFKPYRLGYVAAYYPTHWKGWLITLVTIGSAIAVFARLDSLSHSAIDTLVAIGPYFLFLGIFFDICTRAFGEYPYWWRKKRRVIK